MKLKIHNSALQKLNHLLNFKKDHPHHYQQKGTNASIYDGTVGWCISAHGRSHFHMP